MGEPTRLRRSVPAGADTTRRRWTRSSGMLPAGRPRPGHGRSPPRPTAFPGRPAATRGPPRPGAMLPGREDRRGRILDRCLLTSESDRHHLRNGLGSGLPAGPGLKSCVRNHRPTSQASRRIRSGMVHAGSAGPHTGIPDRGVRSPGISQRAIPPGGSSAGAEPAGVIPPQNGDRVWCTAGAGGTRRDAALQPLWAESSESDRPEQGQTPGECRGRCAGAVSEGT